jgi:hypothetical protein
MRKGPFHCRSCGRFSTCPENGQARKEPCDIFLSWSDFWAQETAAIERAQRITYIAAALLVVLSAAVVLLPGKL